jgi:uroporphyrinogen decarboxylase
MKSRERVNKALLFNEADRVPIDNNGNVSGMHVTAYKNLLAHLGMDDEITIYDPVQQLSLVKKEVRDLLGVDTWYVYPKASSSYNFDIKQDETFADEFGTVYRKLGFYYECYKPPLKGKTLEEIKAYRMPDPQDYARFEGLSNEVKTLRETTDYSIWSGPVNNLFYFAWCMRGMEDFLMDLYTDKPLASYLMDMLTDWNMAFFEKYYEAIGPHLDVFWMGDDWGVQNGPLISPDLFRQEVVPRFKKMIGLIKSKTKAKCCYHSCGSVYWCIEDLKEMGVDIVQPLQPTADGNNTDRIKKDFGKTMVFHGGTNNQGVFHQDIHSLTIDTLTRIKHLAPGGGYIFSSGHNIQANMPPENILRLFELAREYGTYPIDIKKIDDRIRREKESLAKLNGH